MKKWQTRIHNMEQGTEEWLKVREGKITGSVAKTLLTSGFGRGMRTLVEKKATEKVYGRDNSFFETYETNHGHEYEERARKRFEESNKLDVEEVGFIELSDTVGCSPDGIVKLNGNIWGVVEIKCFQKKHHLEVYELGVRGEIEKDIMAQIQFNLMCTGASVGWFVGFYPPYLDVPAEQCFVVVPVQRDEAMIGYMRAKTEMLSDLIEERANRLIEERAKQDAKDSLAMEDMF